MLSCTAPNGINFQTGSQILTRKGNFRAEADSWHSPVSLDSGLWLFADVSGAVWNQSIEFVDCGDKTYDTCGINDPLGLCFHADPALSRPSICHLRISINSCTREHRASKRHLSDLPPLVLLCLVLEKSNKY